MSQFGKFVNINLFGESHGKEMGIVIENLPPGLKLDIESMQSALRRRRPKSKLSTDRQEKDKFKIVSGYFNGYTTGTPLTIIIENNDIRSKDYEPEILRPSHSDYTAYKRYDGYQDYRGSGHFSGRLTAPIVVLGAICDQILAKKDILISSHISSIKDKSDKAFKDINITKELLETLKTSDIPVIEDSVKDTYEQVILAAREKGDSLGGTIETMVFGIAPGYGNPFFDKAESLLSSIIFSIPAVKGFEVGEGFDMSKHFGSEMNDEFVVDNDVIKTKTNHSGGIQGGITNGMPIVFKTAIKPTSSIKKSQKTVNIKTMKEMEYQLEGRHDPSIVPRVVHVINALTSYAMVELISRKEGLAWMK